MESLPKIIQWAERLMLVSAAVALAAAIVCLLATAHLFTLRLVG